ncbi:hypothetical protein HHK36_032356 [Tetracentron sinense]|uniref:VWFA domain-containing protein n=1 Tax=Tetracentron sinense TaxID=13715 RepID=A0A834YAD9_TETSI|nr:hypothetical protein HHK36_032356 [Tetracentron sinense]
MDFYSLSLWLPFLLILLPIHSILFLKQKNKDAVERPNLPPSPPKLPIIGHLHQLGKFPYRSLWRLSEKYGPVMLLHLGRVPTVVVSSAETAREVMKTHDLDCCNRAPQAGPKRLSYNLLDAVFVPYGEHWKEMRKIFVHELFSAKRVQSFGFVREEEVAHMINSISQAASGPVNLTEKLFSLTDTIVCRIAFGKSYEGREFDDGRFHELMVEAMAILASFSATDYFPLYGWIIDMLTGLHGRIEKSFHDFDGFYQRIIDEHLDPEREKPEHEDIIDVMLGLERNEFGANHLTKDNVKAILMKFELMGGQSSRERSWRQSSFRSSSSWSHNGYPQSPYAQQRETYAPEQQQYQYAPPSQNNYGVRAAEPQWNLERRYSRIADSYNTLEQVTEALAHAGLESSNLIVGIDFTKSNEWTGARSFNRRSLHHIGDRKNPYEEAISIIGKTLSAFDEDNLIPCFGFGDASTHDQDVFSFYPDERFCNGFEEVLRRYRQIVPDLRLSGPTSFAPIIEMGTTIVEQSGGQYHVLLIIADGQVTRSVDTEHGLLSPQEQKTVEAIVKASKFPLSIILVGVGDGPWDIMKEFDDNIPARAFDNFQFVNFTEIMSKNVDLSRKQTEFALAALMEIPSQYKATLELNIFGGQRGEAPERVPLPPPHYVSASFSSSKPSHSNSFQNSAPPFDGHDTAIGTAPPASSAFDNHVCPICLSNPKNMAFGCGHQKSVFRRHAATVDKIFNYVQFAGAQSKPE